MVSPADLSDLYLRYDFVQTRDLAKAFLTLSSAILVFSTTFARQTVGQRAGFNPTKMAVMSAWSALLVAIAIAFLSIFAVIVAGGRAVHGGGDMQVAATRAESLLVGASILFILGMVSMVAAGVLSIRLRELADGDLAER